MSQPCVWIFCGGRSAEHDISILSARHIISSLAQTDYAIAVNYISPQGQWWRLNQATDLLESDPDSLLAQHQAQALVCLPGDPQPLRLQSAIDQPLDCYCVFSVLHGTYGEDGVMQGCLETLQLPFVGCDTLASSICMAKHVAKPLMAQSGIPTAPGVILHKHDWQQVIAQSDTQACIQSLGAPWFVKPSQQGSSVGVSKCQNEVELTQAIETAFGYDNVVLIEKCIKGREIECAVLGNEVVDVALPGEVATQGNFYSFDSKYVDADAAAIITPADLNPEQIAAAQSLAKAVYQTLGCQGYARVDLFLTSDEKWFVNEVNTLPGFTSISLFPKNWQVSGLDAVELIKQLINLARQRYEQQQQCQQYVHLHQPQLKQPEKSS